MKSQVLLAAFLCHIIAVATLGAQTSVYAAPTVQAKDLEPIADAVEREIQAGKIPGAVILIGNQEKVIYRRAFGFRARRPKQLPMTEETIFDLASLTKVIATTTAVMQLTENGGLRLEDPIAKYWPEFTAHGKARITVRDLLTHYSGLRAGLDFTPRWSGYDAALRLIAAEKPVRSSETGFLYSDINFVVLGELVRRISGLPLDMYCTTHIFQPLGMNSTRFKPLPDHHARIAPTEYLHGKILWGEVHDPTAYRMGGVAGHAGLFSTADDLSIFAQMLLSGGSIHGVQILSSRSIQQMTTPQSPLNARTLRGLGWDLDIPFVVHQSERLPGSSYGHSGFTGTSIWIDPVSKTYVLILTNRVHPDGKGDVRLLRTQIAKVVAASLSSLSAGQVPASQPSLTERYESMSFTLRQACPERCRRAQGERVGQSPESRTVRAEPVEARTENGTMELRDGAPSGEVKSGIDVLAVEQFAPLSGLRVGLITNHTGRDSAGQRTLDLLHNAPGVKLRALFTPEHGLHGNMDTKVASGTELTTNLPVYSLYGEVRRPTNEMLHGLDALVFDIQDAGTRFYTYVTTMAYTMEAAARKGLAFYVLDRPNPISGAVVQGPIMEADLKSFTGYFPLPVRHGMTVGELARMFNAENKLGVNLHVIQMQGYHRDAWYDETGLQWIAPSPNLRTLTAATLYPGVAVVEGANVSVGRGTATPFALLGAPWIDGKILASDLNKRNIQGVRFLPRDFMPTGDRYANQLCHGVQIIVVDRQVLDAAALGVEIASTLYRLYPKDFRLSKTLGLIGARWVLQAIKDGQDPKAIRRNWQAALDEFCMLRAKYLLYSPQHLK